MVDSPRRHGFSPAVIETIAGFTAGVVSTLALHPLDIIKTRLQVDQQASTAIGSSFRIARDILVHEGRFSAFYRGLTPNLVGSSVSWALYFMWYGHLKNAIQHYRYGAAAGGGQLTSLDYFVASGTSGILTAILTNPIWVLKTRMLSTGANTPGAYTSFSAGVASIYRSEGMRGFYRGLYPSLVGVSYGALQFMAYEQLKRWRAGPLEKSSLKALTNADILLLSGASKIFAGALTYPYQVVRARLQTYDAANQYHGSTDVIRKIWQREGLRGFYKGLGPNMVKVLPSTWVTFLVYENVRAAFWDHGSSPGSDKQGLA